VVCMDFWCVGRKPHRTAEESGIAHVLSIMVLREAAAAAGEFDRRSRPRWRSNAHGFRTMCTIHVLARGGPRASTCCWNLG